MVEVLQKDPTTGQKGQGQVPFGWYTCDQRSIQLAQCVLNKAYSGTDYGKDHVVI